MRYKDRWRLRTQLLGVGILDNEGLSVASSMGSLLDPALLYRKFPDLEQRAPNLTPRTLIVVEAMNDAHYDRQPADHKVVRVGNVLYADFRRR